MAKTHHENYNIRQTVLSLGTSGGSYTLTGIELGDRILGANFWRMSAGAPITTGTATVAVSAADTVTITTIGTESTNGLCSILWVDQNQGDP